MDTLINIYIFIIGLIFGSFFNVCILRPFSNETLTRPKSSKCPNCGHKLAWYDNIPLFSYLILLAKCRYCKAPISWQYPFVELLTGIMFLCTYLTFGLTIQTIFILIFMSYFIIMSGTDFKGQVIFNQHFVPFIVISIIYGLFQGIMTGNYLDSALGMFMGAVIMELYARSGYLFGIKERVCGEGDSYIAAGIGAILGFKFTIIAIVLSVLAQALWSFPMLIVKYAKNKKYSEILTMLVFIFIVISYIIINNLGGFEDFWIYLTYILLMISYAYKVCLELIQSTKLNNDGGLSLPFGPALFFGATIMIFFNSQIISLFKNIDWLQSVL